MTAITLSDLETHLLRLVTDGVCLAYSGGVDSMLLLAVLTRLQRRNYFPLAALLFHSCFQTKEELETAQTDARALGLEPVVIPFQPLAIPGLDQNPENRCYLCKKKIFTVARQFASTAGLKHLLDGTNADDMRVYRPGRQALTELGVLSPLAELGITKVLIRQWSRDMALPAAEYPANACLATRFPYNTTLTEAKLASVKDGEAFLRTLGLKTLRLRLQNDIARIEVPAEDFAQVLSHREAIVSKLSGLGFRYVTLDLAGFRSGSMDR
ncbi:MAG: ATP-dependent sacrificial sulfur transferase LarE [Lentisphaeria bacterium]|jgi:uncharacterized protein